MAQEIIRHPSGIRQEIVDKVVTRRGRLHAFASIEPAKTALVVIDLDLGTGRDEGRQVAAMSRAVNAMAGALRKHGGTVAWVTTPMEHATENFRAVFGDELTERYEADGRSGKSATLWPELETKDTDLFTAKRGHSAFFPGKSDLHEQLQVRGVTTLLVSGAVTNVCCEASARDAAELQYKVTMVSDALIGHSYGLHEATLTTFFRCYGDVRPSGQLLSLLGETEARR